MKRTICYIFCILLVMSRATGVYAQEAKEQETQESSAQQPQERKIQNKFVTNYFYVGDSETDLPNDLESDSFSVHSGTIKYFLEIPTNDTITLHTGVDWTYLYLDGTRSQAPIPDRLHSISIMMGIGVKFSRYWSMLAFLRPGFASDFEDINHYDINVPAGLFFSYKRKRFTLRFGLAVNPASNIPVLPTVGVRWQFADKWTLDTMRGASIEFQVTPDVALYWGAFFNFGTFRVAEDFGDKHGGLRELNNDWLDYREIRIGAGARGRLLMLRWDVQLGLMAYRRMDFDDEELQSETATGYVQIGIATRF